MPTDTVSRRLPRFVIATAAVALLALLVVACDPDEAQPTEAPPTATAVGLTHPGSRKSGQSQRRRR